jgi:hypothetical protein
MRWRGINYDVGIEFGSHHSRPDFDPALTRRELTVIRDELHCNAVRISGTAPERLATAARHALDLGLEVWLSPHLLDHPPAQTRDHLVECARRAEQLRGAGPDLVFVTGCELTLFMTGIMKGRDFMHRIRNPLSLLRLKALGTHNKPLNAFLHETADAVREVFGGPLTYASLPIEDVDWSIFDIVGIDYYRGRQNRAVYGESLAPRLALGKPVAVTEVGLCAYRGAEDRGARGFMIVEQTRTPPGLRLGGDYVRDEALQAGELVDMLGILESAGVDGTFVFTFATPTLTRSTLPRMDLDLAGYGLVATHGEPCAATRPGFPWQPKRSFHAVADFYGGRAGTPG